MAVFLAYIDLFLPFYLKYSINQALIFKKYSFSSPSHIFKIVIHVILLKRT